MRRLIVILGDQLDRHRAVFDGFDAERDAGNDPYFHIVLLTV